MFDWEDEEITNIIWGVEGEKKDHVVPYPTAETYERQPNKEAANVKLIQNTSVSENIDGFGSLLDFSSSKVDHEHTDEKAQVDDDGSQNFDNQAAGRDPSNFIDYGWENVGSFDDLDRMLSNPDLELWPSTKDVPEMLSINSQSSNLEDYLDFETNSGGVIKDERRTKDHGGQKTHKHKMKKEVEGQYRQFINACPSPPRVYSMHPDTSPLSMTPQEKIEKLRRRQQMRALLAIRKKQQEIRHQDDFSNLEIQSHLMQFARHVMMDKTAFADTIVQQFQNVIAGLGIQMRVCIRESLFRLAQGALQRKNDANTNKRSTSVVLEVGGTKSSTRTPDAETKTNPIDRVVARLLFHTPPRELVQSPSKATFTPTINFFSQ